MPTRLEYKRRTFARSLRLLAMLCLSAASASVAAALVPVTSNVDDIEHQLDLDLPALSALECNAEHASLDDVLDGYKRSLVTALRRRGYYYPTVDLTLARTPLDNCWHLAVNLIPGGRATIETAEWKITGAGSVDAVFAPFEMFPFKPGEPLNEAGYEAFKAAILRTALEHGYLDAQFTTHDVAVEHGEIEDHVAIHLTFDSGAPFAFGDTTISAAHVPLDEAVIRNLIPYRAGEPFSGEAIQTLRSRLAAANYFAEYDARPDMAAATDGKVPIVVRLAPLPTHDVTLGAGFATDIGPRGQIAYENRYVTHEGAQAQARARISPVLSDVTATWRFASDRPAENWYTLESGYKHERTDDSDSDNVTLGARRITLLSSGWRRTLGIDATYESFHVGIDDGRTVLLVPSIQFQRSKTNGNELPAGYSVEATLQGAHSALLSDVSFVQAHAVASLGLAAGDASRFLLRGELGGSWIQGFAELPPSYRFFAGGDESVRGYDYKSLGPRASNGDIKGGRNIATGSVEYEHLVLDHWSAAVFFDAGDAFDTFDKDVHYGAGLGIRWHTPVGAIRLDVAHPFRDSRNVRLHIGFGRLQ